MHTHTHTHTHTRTHTHTQHRLLSLTDWLRFPALHSNLHMSVGETWVKKGLVQQWASMQGAEKNVMACSRPVQYASLFSTVFHPLFLLFYLHILITKISKRHTQSFISYFSIGAHGLPLHKSEKQGITELKRKQNYTFRNGPASTTLRKTHLKLCALINSMILQSRHWLLQFQLRLLPYRPPTWIYCLHA